MQLPNLKIRQYRTLLSLTLVFLVAFGMVIFSARISMATGLRATPLFSGEAMGSLQRATEQRLQEPRQTNLQTYRGTVLDRVQPTTSEKVIALTFDDGPDGKTSLEVLDILEQYDVRATFFLIGENVEKYPYVTRRIASLGHAIGNHTLTHAYRNLNPETIAEEIEATSDAIAQLTDRQPIFFRPPLGNMDNGLVDYAKMHDYITVLWSINSGDAIGYPGVKTIARNVLESAHSGGIVLLHDAPWYRQKTIAALPAIIEGLKAQGYRLVTLPELLSY